MEKMWHILGAGAIGNLWACNLIDLGFQARLILRTPQRLGQFSEGAGIRLDQQCFPASAELATAETPVSQLLICTKAPDTELAFNSILHRLTARPKIIVLQNGMGSHQWVSDQLPNAEVAWASTTEGAWLQTPFEVVHAGRGITRIGSAQQLMPWLTELQGGFLQLEIDPEIRNTLWRKLAINCAINPLTAVFQCSNGELITNPDYLSEMIAICHEVEAVAEALNIELFEAPLVEQACQVAEMTANNYSSMHQDIRHGRTTEIDYITGYICDLAEQQQINVPVSRRYLNRIHRLQQAKNSSTAQT
ncbi:2-dehydropantoate 2-reductase [Neptuniibacter halophilus]|uniref:2-dehydropantoate 2-reductase n=1 Tax=Neptuniibacter halophilus TaxID=651666 RepID=UPI00257471E9|nr:2-dehydropantoate 2-reductase [Neptuniibacter halophilus]